METNSLLLPFGLTLLAGLSTGIGSLISLLAKKQNTNFLCVSLGFSAGVMIYVSFVEILPQAQEALVDYWGHASGSWAAVLAFFGGIMLVGIIDRFIPEDINPHELGHKAKGQNSQPCPDSVAQAKMHEKSSLEANSGMAQPLSGAAKASLNRTGLLAALAITVHNFPEGIATFMAALTDPALGMAIAVAIAIHNIPEGIAVAVPIYYATGSRKKAVVYSTLSGLAEPLGALVAFALLLPFFSPAIFGIMFACVAGIMVFISLDELLPAAEEYGAHHLCIYGLVAGMALMAISLLLLG